MAKVGEVWEHEVQETVLAIVAHHRDGPVAEMVLRQLRSRQQEGLLEKVIVGNGTADCSGGCSLARNRLLCRCPREFGRIAEALCAGSLRWGSQRHYYAAALHVNCSRSSACRRGRAGRARAGGGAQPPLAAADAGCNAVQQDHQLDAESIRIN